MTGSVGRVARAHARSGTIPGAVVLVEHGDEVEVLEVGTTAFGDTEPVRRDALFRISSLTKPLVAAATMLLVDDGVLRLDEPVDRLLPELADRRVLTRLDAPLRETVPARRAITVRDLLTLRMGFGFAVGLAARCPVVDAAAELELGMGPPKPPTLLDPDEWLRRFATLPLMHQPGERWMYPMAASVLGVLVARAADAPLGTFLRDRLTGPLGMGDTGFSVPPGELHRLLPCYALGPDGGLELYDTADDTPWSSPPAFPDAAGGLVSTVDDLAAFARMLRARGLHRGERLLSEASVLQMTTDQLTPAQRTGIGNVQAFLGGSGWGLGMEVGSGRYGWFGGMGTSWYTDPRRDLTVLVMTQRMPPALELHDEVWNSLTTTGRDNT